MIKQVKAQSHIETILSFVIFAGFLFTLLIFLNPINQKSTNTAVLDFAERQIVDNLSITHEKISLIIDTPVAGCFRIPNDIGAGAVILVKDSQDRVRNSKISADGSFMYIQATAAEKYYLIYYNSVLNVHELTDIGPCTPILPGAYSYGLHDKDKKVLYENLVAFNNSFNTNYDSLKSSLNIKSEFVFSVFNQTNSMIMSGERARPSAINILSRNIPLLAVNRDMNRTDIILNLRVWE